MEFRNYSVYLDEEVVEKAKELFKKYGSKLSPLINQLLKEWCEKEGMKDG
jgi:antitoxin component of RelBE/YafQ-DinJ toxin-antitoxin module